MKMELNKKSILTMSKNFILTVAGTLILALGTALFVIPFDLIVGGISSLAILLNKLIGSDFFTMDMLITIVTWALFFIGLFVLGLNFALKTLISAIVYPIGISLFSKLVDPNVMNGFFCLTQSEYSEISILLATLFGGVLIGAGCAITFVGGGSTGGVDIIAFLICKIFKKFRSSVVIFIIDALTIIMGIFVIKDFVLSLLGITSAFISAIVVDKIFLGESKAFIAQIISDKYEDINAQIINGLERTTTIIDATGGYSRKPKKMLMVSFTMAQYSELLNIITKTDKTAFVTIHRAHEVNGEGWTW